MNTVGDVIREIRLVDQHLGRLLNMANKTCDEEELCELLDNYKGRLLDLKIEER